MLALAFFFGLWLAVKRAQRVGVEPSQMMDMSVWGIVTGIIGARLTYVAFHWGQYSDNPISIINPFGPEGFGISGLILYGGLIPALAVGFLYIRRHRLPFWRTADAFAPSIASGIFLVRMGCFLNGCCFGKPSQLPWAMGFPPDSPAGFVFPHTPIHPTQLYSSAYGLIIFGLLLFLERFKKFDGFTFWLLLAFYAVTRFLVDFARYYENSMILFRIGKVPVLFNQGICVLLFILAGTMLLVLRKKSLSS
jgi:phosphatidylglycerol:prolipoprotein diacylglycerol transferase